MDANVISLCDGCSCGRLTLEKLGFNIINYLRSEIKPYADKISDKNFPMSESLGDMTKITEEDIKRLSFKIHVIISGTPCQSHSRNGKHGGFEDPRGDLFFDFVNILNWIREYNNPDVIFFFENVQMKKQSVDLISGSLGVEVIKLDSTYFSSQTRLRYYWTNLKVDEVIKNRKYTLRDILQENLNHKWFTWEEVNELVSSKSVKIDSTKKVELILDGENIKVPAWSTYSYKFLELYSHPYLDSPKGEMRARNATRKGYVVLSDYDTISISFPNSTSRRGRNQAYRFATLDVGCNQMIYVDGKFRYPTLIELERAQGLPDNYTEGVSITNRKDLVGEGWSIDTIMFLLKNLKETLTNLEK